MTVKQAAHAFYLPKAPQLSRYLRKHINGDLITKRQINRHAVIGWNILCDYRVIGAYYIIHDSQMSKILEITFAGQDPEDTGEYVHLTYEKTDTGYSRTDKFKRIPFP